MLKPLYMTKSSLIFYNVHLKNSNVKFEYAPEIENFAQKYPIYRAWDSRVVAQSLEYDRKSTLYVEKFTLRKYKVQLKY